MNFGSFELEQLSEGHFVMSNKGHMERYRPAGNDTPETVSALGSPYFELVGVDPLLIRGNGRTVLVDAGLGLALDEKRRDQRISNLVTNLEVLEIEPASITDVVLSHLHEDHVCGLVYSDAEWSSKPTLPNARIHVQRLEWEYALDRYDSPNAIEGSDYFLDDLFKLVADGRFVFLENEHVELIPGLELIRTGGHTPGHQIVRLNQYGKTAYFPGDLIATSAVLNRYHTRTSDADPIIARHQKMFWLKRIFEEQALVFFYHNPEKKTGRVIRDQLRMFRLEEVPDSQTGNQ